MREMKDSGIEWVGEIPTNWKTMANKYVMTKKKDIKKKYEGEDILSLTMDGVIVRDLDAGGKMPATFDGYQIINPNNLLMCLFDYDVTPRCIGYITRKGLTSPAYSQFVMRNHYCAKYFYYYYLLIDFTKELLHLAKNLRYSFTEEQLGNIKVPVPPINEQQAIADFLDKKCAEIDALHADIEKEIDILQKYKQSVITEAVTKGLDLDVEMKDSEIEWVGLIPAKWNSKKAKYIFKQRNTKGNHIKLQLLSPTQKFGVIPQMLYEQISGMQTVKLNNNVDLKTMKTIHSGDFCISLRSFQGGFEYSEYEGVVSPAYHVFYPYVEVNRSYFRYLFKDVGFIKKMNSYAMNLRDGKNISFEDFGNTYIPVPDIVEQKAIADFLEEKCNEIENLVSAKNKQLESLDNYKKSLIYEYVTGKKEVPTNA